VDRWPVAAAGVLVVVLVLALAAVRPVPVPGALAPVVAGVAIAAGVGVTGEGGDALTVVYVLIVLHAASFLGARALAAVVAVLLAAHAVALASRDLEAPALAWGITAMSLVATATLVHRLRARSEALVRRLAEAAALDPLTGVPNRREAHRRLDDELERVRRHRVALSVLLGDLDRFKELNDREGHPAGDDALRTVAQVLTEGTRRVDTVARIGGDEFLLILPQTDAASARELAERLARAVRDALRPAPVPVTISFGVAAVAPGAADASGDALVAAADRALYAEKRRRASRTRA
jgi:diguanylate cyclase (GGDEF)-like protein